MDFLPPPLNALSALKQFVLYKLVPRKNKPGKFDKVPIDPTTLRPVDPLDARNWLDEPTALQHLKPLDNRHGLGFVFTENDPYWFLDIDNCLEPCGTQWSPLARSLIDVFKHAAIEVSSSGKGLHIIGSGQVPIHGCDNNSLSLGFYTTKRFVALTGLHMSGSVAADYSALMPWLVENYFPCKSIVSGSLELTTGPNAKWYGPDDDDELIDRMLRSQSLKSVFGKGASFKDLWEANFPVLEKVYHCDGSSYDAALAQHLAFWTGNHGERILRLMLRSGLARDKWEREDYLPRTIRSACSKQTEFLTDKPQQETKADKPQNDAQLAKLITGNTYLTIEQQLELFRGCVYICDIHRALTPGGRLLKSDQFRVMYGGFSFPMDAANERVTRNAWEAFTESQAFELPLAHSSCFRPRRPPGEVIAENGDLLANLWWPIQTPRKPGDAGPFLEHLAKVLPDARDQTILLSYMAACVQYKGVKFQWAPLLQGVEGNGKTLFTLCVAFAIGDRYTHFPKASEISTKFNDWMYCKLFIGVEDIYVPESQREVLEALKPMITRNRLEIEAKGIAKLTLDVCCNFILNSNHKDGIRKTRNNRIFAPFHTAQQSVADLQRDGMNGAYFSRLYGWLQNSCGYEIVSELLHTYAIPDEYNPATHCQRSPDTTSTEDAIAHSMGGVEQEVLEAIAQDSPGFRGGWVSSIMLNLLLDRVRASRKIPHNRRRDLMQSLGYDLHPALRDGRVNNAVLPDAGKPRLFVKNDNPARDLLVSADIERAYSDAQKIS